MNAVLNAHPIISLNPFDELKRILRPWLGDVFCFNLPASSDDICCLISEIKGHGFTHLSFRNNPANPDWILEKWRTYTETECPRCNHRIMALLKSHRISRHTRSGAPFIFCDCIRIEPSRLPSLSFFTDNWHVALAALDYTVAFANAHKTAL
jgi:hypothetical protein